MLLTFLGILLWWVKALPLIIIVVVVVALLLYDFVQHLALRRKRRRPLTLRRIQASRSKIKPPRHR